MKILTNQKLGTIAFSIIKLQKLINECDDIDTQTYLIMVDMLSTIAKESLDKNTFMYVYDKMMGE